jgi:hypothetical protein
LIGVETGIKTIAAVHSQCRSWVIRDRAIQNSWPLDVRFPPKATGSLRRHETSLCANSVDLDGRSSRSTLRQNDTRIGGPLTQY